MARKVSNPLPGNHLCDKYKLGNSNGNYKVSNPLPGNHLCDDGGNGAGGEYVLVSNPLPGNHLCDKIPCIKTIIASGFQTRFRETTSVTVSMPRWIFSPMWFQTRFRETTSVT